jgi:hypothetical protein
MVRFEELQHLWQNQPQPAAAAVDLHGMAAALRRFGRRQIFINIFKVAIVAWQTWFCLSRLGLSALTVIGQALFLAGVANMLMTDWRAQAGIARLDFAKASVSFVDSVLERLRDPNAPFRRRFWLQITLIVAGINLMFAARWGGTTLEHRILAHLTATGAPFAGYMLGLMIRSRRYAVEYRPLMERLTAMKRALEEQSQ